MSESNLGARFGWNAAGADAEESTAKPAEPVAGDPFEQDRPVSMPRRRPAQIAVALWLPKSVLDRLSTHCKRNRTTRREALLQAVEKAAPALPDLIEADARRRAEQALPTDDVGGLFPRPSEPVRPGRPVVEPSTTITVRMRADHVSTMDRIASDHDLSRSGLARIALDSYLG